jgi:phenylalanyl-tRNA synthetase beta chain
MLVPLSWLKDYVDPRLSVDDLCSRLSLCGLEVESVRHIGEGWDRNNLIVGRIVSVQPHPDSDRLVVAELDTGGGQVERVVTGAPNIIAFKSGVPAHANVAYARAGASVNDPTSATDPPAKKLVKPVVLRGVASAGMLCSSRELGISDDHEGVLVLPPTAAAGTPLLDLLGDDILELAILPDAARCLSLTGVAREVASLVESPLHIAEPPEVPASGPAADAVRVRIDDPALGYRYIAIVIRGVKIGPSPAWMKQRLEKAGVKSINNVVDITNYVMLEWGQPSHAFDYQKLKARALQWHGHPAYVENASSGGSSDMGKMPMPLVEISVRPAAAGEVITTLDGVVRKLETGTLVIADSTSPVAVAGVMGGQETEIGPETHDVLLEVAAFNRVAVRRAAQQLKMSSEASYRFSRGIPQRMCMVAARRLVQLLAELAGGRVAAAPVDCYPTPQADAIIYLTASEVRRQLGFDVAVDEIVAVLRRLDFAVEIGTPAQWPWKTSGESAFGLRALDSEPMLRCIAPWYRLDARIPADLVEEVARMLGFDRVNTTLLNEELPRMPRDPIYDVEENVRDILIACGLQETINYALTTPDNHEKLGLVPPKSDALYVTLANPLNSERTVMRRSLLVSAVENLAYNARFTNRMANFEIGRVYLPEQGDGVRPREERRLCIALTGPRRKFSVHADPAGLEPFDFYDLKGIVEALLRKCGLRPADYSFVPRGGDETFSGRSALLMVRGQPCGVLGELSPFAQSKTAPRLPPIFLAEFPVAPLRAGAWARELAVTVNRFPAVIEDLAFVVDENVPSEKIVASMRAAGGTLLTDIELFDIFRGPPLQASTKSLAYRVTYQAEDRTPAEAEVLAARQRIIAQVVGDTGGALRGL